MIKLNESTKEEIRQLFVECPASDFWILAANLDGMKAIAPLIERYYDNMISEDFQCCSLDLGSNSFGLLLLRKTRLAHIDFSAALADMGVYYSEVKWLAAPVMWIFGNERAADSHAHALSGIERRN